MHSDTAIEKNPTGHSRRKHAGGRRPRTGAEAQEGPVFVDSSGRRARLLRRAAVALGIACVGYAAVLGLAFMGGISMSPSDLLPFDGAPSAQGGPQGITPPGVTGAPPSGPPADGAGPSPSASVSVSLSATAATG
ncbi:hypothetical protein ABZS81_00405 [Streptomyces sp. NPDC005318]|uniref:hypothetical protein n=1 Tax=Streptomyces sp. NPDC005318 TaxID=3157031 RepID=UPI00339E472B